MKKKKTKKRRRVILLIAEIILILLLTLLLFAVVKLSKIQKTKLDMDQVAINEDLSSETMDAMSDYRTVALFGLDNLSLIHISRRLPWYRALRISCGNPIRGSSCRLPPASLWQTGE